MTLLIHFLMCLTTLFERGGPEDEPSQDAQPVSEETASSKPEIW